ncbi:MULTISPECIES: hypothetical protein [Enterobacter]|uniref:Uncharacterized protein n=1 Tax=Enterobacter cancerogenus TaxID=69218 RepID=A0ABX8KJH0_9ENTR|nr:MULTISPECIES: hypothetical protein [Enterobacter]KAA1060376.1 hypothetical protein D5265_016420 [Enterobacter mori]QXA49269.1 hypothetical protein I6L58_21755 [Enterobacter cancerogenus]
MQQQSAIARRLSAAFTEFGTKDYETTLLHLFPALDSTAKKRRPKSGVGDRIRKFLEDDEDLLSFIALGLCVTNIEAGGKTIPQAIYEYGRCSIEHEGELDKRLTITEEQQMLLGGQWVLPVGYIFGMMMLVLVAPENKDEKFTSDFGIIVRGVQFNANESWGQILTCREKIGLNAMKQRISSSRHS